MGGFNSQLQLFKEWGIDTSYAMNSFLVGSDVYGSHSTCTAELDEKIKLI